MGNGTVNTTNNWWKSNNPIISSANGSDIYIAGGNVTYNPWLVLNLTANPSVVGDENSTLTADLTRNSNGADTSSQGHLPNGIPVNFTTNLGTITTTAYTGNGKANATFNRGSASSGTATVTTTIDNQSIQTNITIIDTIAPTVTASLANGTYNSYQNVTLTVTDNIDQNPHIYYTLDGSTPTTSSILYTAPINIFKNITTLKFMAVDAAGNQAQIQSRNYVINLPIININTEKVYSHIQDAINDQLTINGHTIQVNSGTYTENIIVNKNLTIKAREGNNDITIQAATPSSPVITITSTANGSTIQGFIIKGATDYNKPGIYLNGATNCNITNNILTGNFHGIDFSNSNNNTIQNNTIQNNNWDGLHILNSNNNKITGNTIKNQTAASGIYLNNSNNIITENTITDNDFGIYLYQSSSTIQFNRITNNDICGLWGSAVSITAINNWWGTNNPKISTNYPSDIWATSGTITYNPWIVLTISSSSDIVSHDSSSSVTADLTRNNQGNDTSPYGKIPNGIPINYSTTLGTIGSPASTMNGKSVTTFNSSATAGTATVSATLDKQTVSKTIINVAGAYNQRTKKTFTTIQAAIDDATTLNGDTILVGGGTYTENVIVAKQLILMSAYGKNVTVQPMNSSQPAFTVYSSGSTIKGFNIKGSTNYGIFLYQVNNCNITGNTITNCSGGIFLYYSNNTSISENNATNNTENGIDLYYSNGNMISGNNLESNGLNGIYIDHTNNNTISGNNATKNTLKGIYVDNSKTTTIIRNNATNNKQIGILINNSNSTWISENNIKNNICENIGGGLVLIDTNNTTISTNNLTNNTNYGLLLINSNNNTISSNNATNNTMGINLQKTTNNTISLNNVTSNIQDGIMLLYSSNSILSGNNITNNLNYGICLDNSDNTKITENKITNNLGGIYLYFSPTNVNFNRIVGNTAFGLCNAYSNFVNATNNWWGTNSPTVSSSNSSDIYILGGNIIYDPWIVLNVNSTYITDGISNITVDLTYNNQGTNTLPLGHIPNGTNVNFTTDYGSIQQSGFTVNGKTTSQLNYSSPHNTANITVTLDNQIISKTVNLFKVYNTVSHQGFTTIQAAINAPSTSAGDIIEVASGTYVENIVLTKKLTIRAVPGGTVTLQALNPNLPVFTIKTNGTGSKISGFVINGTNSSFGILLENANECIIENNNINGNFKGIYLFQSSRNSISNNTLFNNTYGIFIPAECTYQISSFSLNNTISQNNIRNNCYGIYLWGDWSGIGFIGGINTIDTSITSNIIYGNVYGVYSNSSQFNMHFNQLSNNTMADLWLEVEEGISFDARNNWWGTSNLIIEWDNYDPEVTYDVYSEGGIDGWYCNDLIYGVIPWLVLNVTANPVITNGNSTVTADLTHNSNGNDTSPQGHVPDGIPIDITTSLGAVTSPVYTRNGKATLTFNSGTVTSGIANITATLDRQSVQTNVTIDKIAPTVNASLSSGLYNTSQSVNLTASDNIDLHPIIYYTTDGSNPTTSSAIYTTSITISTTTTLKFMAVDFTGNQSPVNMVYYIFSPIGNLNTGKGYSSIQNAINDNLTVNGNVIVVRNGTYTENIVVNKKLTITPYNGNVTIQAANLNNPAITINSGGSGSVISGFTLKGANGTSSSGIYLNNASNCTITGNILTGNYYGLLLTNSPNNMIWDNNLTGNLMEGIRFNSSNNNTVYSNTIINNSGTGIYIGNSLYSLIMENTIQNNLMNGIELNNSSNSTVYENTIMNNHQSGIKATSSSASINFNIIAENTVYGLYNLVNGTVNATNNWWGTNNLTVSSTNGSSIYIAGGTVLYNPWLVMNLTGSVIYVTHNSTSSSEITADITHNNQGKDTSGSGRIPDGLPVNFTTTLGTINSTATVRSGKARVTLTSSPSSGATTVTATLGNYSVSRAFHKSFSTIQGAVSDPLTVDGDVIFVTNGTYVENIVINKNLTIVSEGNVTVQASNISSPVFTVNNCSDSMIYGFKITGATNSSAIYLNRANNCYILDNTITGNGLSSTGDFGYGIFLNSTTNCTVSGNILQGNLGGIDLEYSNNTLLSGNNITGSTFRGVYLYQANYTTISESNLANNDCGILACYSNNLKVTSNDVKNNTYHGIYLYYSSGDLHFNRIVGNGQYGLLSRGGTVNATNNWWGTNNPVVSSAKPSAIYVISGSVLYNPRLVLTITPTSYKVADGKVYEATITADLNHNSNNEDLSTVIYTPDGIPVTFISNNNSNITSTSYTEDGKASATLILNPNLQSGFTNVTATLDSQSASTSVDRIAKATIIISSTAIDLSTNHSLYLTYEVPLNESVSWVSVLWKSKSCDFGSFQNEVDLIVNGVVVLNKTVSNINYLINHDSFSPKVWYNVNFLNWLFSESTESKNALKSIIYQNPGLQNLTGSALETGLLNMIREKNGFNDSEMFVIANYKYFKDNITTIISYPGDAGKKISFEDPDSGEVVGINFPGNPIYRESTMIYANGGYFHVDNRNDPTSRVYKNEGYEGVRSFAIVTTKVTDEMLRYWLDEKDRTNANGTLLYPEGPMKAAYGTFLESLLVIKCHDIVADAAANKYNVTWSRTTPIVV
ncbi:MAG: right-handed parallel beta-helix repeat-containing protein, partial [Methanobacteriaceae archaeon]|nr:right-handed parallel beta-helix repeat-containing protein [Methanobacteriaceae archaeon]